MNSLVVGDLTPDNLRGRISVLPDLGFSLSCRTLLTDCIVSFLTDLLSSISASVWG